MSCNGAKSLLHARKYSIWSDHLRQILPLKLRACHFCAIVFLNNHGSLAHPLKWVTAKALLCHLKDTLPQRCLFLTQVTRSWSCTLQRDGLGSKAPLCLSSVVVKRRAHAAPGPFFLTRAAPQSALDCSGLEPPWQTPRILLRFQSSAVSSKWTPICKPTRRTSRGGKTCLELDIYVQHGAQIHKSWRSENNQTGPI